MGVRISPPVQKERIRFGCEDKNGVNQANKNS